METKYGKHWLPILGDHRIMDLMESVAHSKFLVPRADPMGGMRYPDAEKILGKEPQETQKILDDLVTKGIFERKVFSKDIGCPSCNGLNISTVYLCNRCSSINISKNALIEHIPCGNIAPKDTFVKASGMVCPNCNIQMEEGKYKRIGSWYECSDCKKRISSPETQHVCRNCALKFTFEDAKYEDVYCYSLNEAAFNQLRTFSDSYQPVRDLLSQSGYENSSMGRIKGASGVTHEFALLATKGNEQIVVEVIISKEPIEQGDVVQWFAKVIDTKANAYFVAVPGLEGTAAKLAAAYQLKVIEAETVEEAALKLLERIKAVGSVGQLQV